MTATAALNALRTVDQLALGQTHGPITRLVSPSDLGERLKPFVFLDYFNAPITPGFGFPMHPHSGIATLTWQPQSDVAYRDTTGQSGVLKAGGLEWMNAAGGAWHQASLMGSGQATGFQLWVAMPPGVENGTAYGQYVAPQDVPVVPVAGGSVRVLLGEFRHGSGAATEPGTMATPPSNIRSNIPTHQDMHYLVVQLEAGARWRHCPPPAHDVAFAVGFAGAPVVNGSRLVHTLAVLGEAGDIEITAPDGPVEVLIGTAAKHPWDLVLGPSSVHTSRAALAQGLATIRAIGAELQRTGQLHA